MAIAATGTFSQANERVKPDLPVLAPSFYHSRIEAIDLARGIAIALMILSHGVKALLTFEQIPDWGLVPIHLVTKFASTLFIVVFGLSLGIAFVPHVGTPAWPAKRRKLLFRGLVVFFCYKVLTVVEMFATYSREDVIATLAYQAFPVYVEILGYYALALLWLPFVLPLWNRTPIVLKFLLPAGLYLAAVWAHESFHFWGSEMIRALLVEHDDHYTWGQFSRLPLVMIGLLVADWARRHYAITRDRVIGCTLLFFTALCLLFAFRFIASPVLMEELIELAKNEGKHPPSPLFLLFSTGGALAILAIALAGGSILAKILRPLTYVGQNSLRAFVFHIVVIFVGYRYLLGLWKAISYEQALVLTAITLVLTPLWLKTSDWVRSRA